MSGLLLTPVGKNSPSEADLPVLEEEGEEAKLFARFDSDDLAAFIHAGGRIHAMGNVACA